MTAVAKSDVQHPIQVVSRRTGLSQDVIRVWERRYRAVDPVRSETNRRLYSDEDIRRLMLLRRATLGGRRIGDVAGLPTAELMELVAEDEAASRAAGGPVRASEESSAAPEHLRSCVEAIEDFDPARLEIALANAAVDLTTPALIEELLEPLMRSIGDRWRDGSLRVAQEHLATAIVHSFLQSLRSGARSHDVDGPDLVVTTPARQVHELGALMAAVAASMEGWRVTYLGANLPAEEIAATVRLRGSRAVALSIVYPADDPKLSDELRRLRRLLPDLPLLSGGAAAAAYDGVLQEIGAVRVEDMRGLRSRLQAMRGTD